MKPSERLQGVGRPVAFYPTFVQICGSVNAALMLSQLFYWTERQHDPDGWIYKNAKEWKSELKLSYKEQYTARAALTKRGFVEERYRRLVHRLEFRVCLEAVQRALLRLEPPAGREAGTCQTEDGTCQTEGAIHPMGSSLIGNYIEHPQTTSSNRTGSAKGVALRASEQEEPPVASAASPAPMPEWDTVRAQACAAFERALMVKHWPWRASEAWKRLADLVAAAWHEDPNVFVSYVEWADGRPRHDAFTPKQIRMYPEQFIDTGWPMFLASRNHRAPERVQVETELERRIREGVGLR